MRYLVTGGTGFVGANLVRHLLERGHEVRCVVRKAGKALEGLPVECVEVGLKDEPGQIDQIARVVEGCDGVYHVAGIFDPGPGGEQRMADIHVGATRALLRACDKAGVRRLLVCSSSITVGWGPRERPGDEDSPLDPNTYGRKGALRAYHDTKLESEALAASWSGPTEVVVANPDYIIGAWDVKPTSGQLIISMARGYVPLYPRGGKFFQDADDCAIGHILVFEKGRPGRRYLLGTENLSYREFMGKIARALGRRAPLLPVPNLAMRAAGLAGALRRASLRRPERRRAPPDAAGALPKRAPLLG
jgi:dihydroflavonol-4-reductase